AATLLCLYFVHPLPCAYAHGYKDTGATRLLAKHKVLQMIHCYTIVILFTTILLTHIASFQVTIFQ
ncbi:MAG: hypothetical protein LBH32_10995, partial [Dysgonamonadaceae bacterium]|nr:hypothetical protein [Dysgonamonadaceae bacterium]